MKCRCEHCAFPAAPTFTEAHRHACEVRMLVAKPQRAREWYVVGERGVKTLRGDAAADKIIASLKEAGAWKD